MPEAEKKLISEKAMKEYQDELSNLKKNARPEIAQKIKEAREQGDLSENAEYDAARDEQRDIEARISELEEIINNSEVYDESEMKEGHVNLDSTVKLMDLTYDEEVTFRIVSSTEADSLNGKISNESPVGRALMNKKKGNKVKVETPQGVIEYKILDVTRDKA